MASARASTAAIDALVFDFFVAASDTVTLERRGICNPIAPSSASFADNADYCRQALYPWKRDVSKPIVLDLYIFDPKLNKHVLLERWKFFYQKAHDLKDTKQLPIISRRITTLLRTMHSFVRLLPGFNLSSVSPKLPTLSFQIYEQKSTYPTNFVTDSSSYRFDQVSTSKGLLIVSVKFMMQPFVKEILVNLNGGAPLAGVPSSGHSRRNSRTAEDSSASAAIPIPNKDHLPTQHDDHMHHGKHMNSRLVQAVSAPSQDPTAENSSVSTVGTPGSATAAATGSTPPLGNRYSGRTTSRDRETHRRSFQLPSHAEYGEGYPVGSAGEDASEALRHLQARHPTASQQAGQATSLDSYGSREQYMYNQHQQQQTSRPGSFRLPPASGGVAPSTSYASTPPFAMGEVMAHQGERYSGSDAGFSRDTLPYAENSASLTSTSPHFGSFMLALREKRTGTFGGLPLSGGNPTGRYSPSAGLDVSDLKFKLHPLPVSPFQSGGGLDATLFRSGDASTALVPSTTPRGLAISPGSVGRPLASLSASGGAPALPAVGEEDGTLDTVKMMESQRMSLENADGLDLYAFRTSMDSYPGGPRMPSKERSSEGTDGDLPFDEQPAFTWQDGDPDLAGDSLAAGFSRFGFQQGAGSSYTGPGLSGELLGKISEFKSFSASLA